MDEAECRKDELLRPLPHDEVEHDRDRDEHASDEQGQIDKSHSRDGSRRSEVRDQCALIYILDSSCIIAAASQLQPLEPAYFAPWPRSRESLEPRTCLRRP